MKSYHVTAIIYLVFKINVRRECVKYKGILGVVHALQQIPKKPPPRVEASDSDDYPRLPVSQEDDDRARVERVHVTFRAVLGIHVIWIGVWLSVCLGCMCLCVSLEQLWLCPFSYAGYTESDLNMGPRLREPRAQHILYHPSCVWSLFAGLKGHCPLVDAMPQIHTGHLISRRRL